MPTGRERFQELLEATPTVLPSLLLCDFGNLEREIEALEEAGVAGLHLDVMDGVFVPNFTYGITIVNAIRKLTELPLDVHLMMVHPEKYIDQFCDAGADSITFHAEASQQPDAVIEKIHSHQAAAGIAINPDTAVETLLPHLSTLDLVLVMSVQAGFGGQSFQAQVLDKFDQIRNANGGQQVALEIDGGINVDTIQQATDRGAQLLVAGSAIFKQQNYTAALENLMSQIDL